MKPEKWRRIQTVFEQALECDTDRRRSFVVEACGGDQELEGEVFSLLDNPEATRGFLTPEEPPDTMKGRVIGHYRILRRLGDGGMGAVYLGERADNEFRKLVAIKTVRSDLVDRQVLRRFKNERQTLAALDHPNIVSLLDGGTTEDGVPFLVMDYVKGQPIDEYCRVARLGTREILELFRTVCTAVHYAHQNLIVHRDLKPSNIIVTTEGVPKLLDFGIAKLMKAEYGSNTVALTRTEFQPMTPEFASPEQVLGQPITTATDVYSLGILLYELTTGRIPYALKTGSLAELWQAVCNQDPERPGLGADLDNIVLTALRKEPQRRYASVQHLSEDIRCYLEGLPVSVHGDSFRYRVGKFASRHKAGVAAASLVVVALIASTIVSSWYASVASAARARAEQRLQDVRQLATFVLFSLDDAIRTGPTAARKLAVTRALESLNRLVEDSADNPALQRDLIAGYLRIGDIQGNPYVPNLGDTNGAITSYRKALDLAGSLQGGGHHEQEDRRYVAVANMKIGEVFALARNSREAMKHYDAALKILEQFAASEPGNTQVRQDLGSLWEKIGSMQFLLGKLDEAAESYRRYLETGQSVYAPDSAEWRLVRARANEKLGQIAARNGNLEEGVKRIGEALTLHRRLAADTPGSAMARRAVASTHEILADVFANSEKIAAASAEYARAIAITEQLYKEDPENRQFQRDLYRMLGFQASLMRAQKRQAEADRLAERSRAVLQNVLGQWDTSWYDHRFYAWLLLSTPQREARHVKDALRHAQRAAEMTNNQDPGVLDTLARALDATGQTESAVEVCEKALALVPKEAGSPASHMREGLAHSLAEFKRKLAGESATADRSQRHAGQH
jgi:non-specific serine/threonine protein kinase/serine/threonine-protein kinase